MHASILISSNIEQLDLQMDYGAISLLKQKVNIKNSQAQFVSIKSITLRGFPSQREVSFSLICGRNLADLCKLCSQIL